MNCPISNQITGKKMCAARSRHGYLCTRPSGQGKYHAHGFTGEGLEKHLQESPNTHSEKKKQKIKRSVI